MRILMLAVLTVFMGFSFTSCLDSGESIPQPDVVDYVTITGGFMGVGLNVKTDNGLTLNVKNPGAMEITLTGGDKFTPTRALACFYFAEGEVYEKDKTEYDVLFASDYVYQVVSPGYFYVSQEYSDFMTTPLDTKTKVQVDLMAFGGSYLDTYIRGLVYEDEFKLSDFKLCITGVENETIKAKVMNLTEIPSDENKAKYLTAGVSFRAPSVRQMEHEYPELKPFGSSNDSVYLLLDNENLDSRQLEKIKIKLQP